MIEQKEPTRTQDERFVEQRLRDRSSTNEPPGWFNDLVGKPLAYRLRWAAQRFEAFRANNKSAALQWQFELKAYSCARKDAISQGLVVAEQIQWVEDQDGKIQVLRFKKRDGTVHPVTSPVFASDESRRKTWGEFDMLRSLITDTVREAKSLYPDFIAVDSALARICDDQRRIGCDVPEWARLKGLQIPDGKYLLEGGDSAVGWYWSDVQPELVQLAISIEQRRAAEVIAEKVVQWGNGRLSDGLAPPNRFVWNGKVYELSPQHWRLLNFMWDRENATLRELEAAVWDCEVVQSNTVNVAVSKLNTKLLGFDCPISFSIKSGYITKT